MFISRDKFDKLRDSARNGDEKASSILRAFRNDEDISALLDDYFKPIVEAKVEPEVEVAGDSEEMSKLEKYLSDNNVHEGDADYDEYVSEFYEMFPEEKGNNASGAIDVIKDKLDIHGDGDNIIVAEKGQLDNPDSPKITTKVNDNEFETLKNEFHGEESEEENPFTDLIDDEVDAIEGYQKFLNELLTKDMCPEKRALIVSKIEKIIEDEKQHIEILKELSCHKEEDIIL